MLAKRLLAVLLAVGLVLGALIVRRMIDDDGDAGGSGGGSGGGTGPATTAPGTPFRLTCISELRAACLAVAGEDVTVSVAPAGSTATALEGDGAPPADAWVTFAPFPQIVDETRDRANLGPVTGEATDLGSTPLTIVGPADRMAVLRAACGGTEATWKCIGGLAGRPWVDVGGQAAWNEVTPGHASPVDTAAGLLVLGEAVTSYFEGGDVAVEALGLADFDDPAFREWFTNLETSIPDFGSEASTPFEQMLLTPRFDAVGTTDAEVTTQAGAQLGRLTVTYPSPMGRAFAVVVPLGGASLPDGLADELRAELATTGFVPDVAPGPTLTPGALVALQQLWREVT